MCSRWGKALTGVLLAVTVSMTTGEFIAMQQLPVEDLRARFRLPLSCDPAVTALNTDPAANQITVAIECRARPAPGAPMDRRAPRPTNKPS